MQRKTKPNNPGNAANKGGQRTTAMPVSPALISAVSASHPDQRDALMLAAHCVTLARESYPSDHPLLDSDGIFPDGITEWLLENAEDLPKPIWLKIGRALRTLFALLLQAHPHDFGFLLASATLDRPNLYDIQRRFMEEERVVGMLGLEGNPALMKALGLPEDCIDCYGDHGKALPH